MYDFLVNDFMIKWIYALKLSGFVSNRMLFFISISIFQTIYRLSVAYLFLWIRRMEKFMFSFLFILRP